MKKMLFIILVFIQLVLGINILFGQKINNNELKAKIETYASSSATNGCF